MNNGDGSGGAGIDVTELYFENEELLERIERVIAASDADDVAGLGGALRDLLERTVTRFELEERLMSECRYEGAETHRLEHRQLLGEIRDQLDDMAGGRPKLAYIGRFMRNWVMPHIVNRDSQFVNAILTQSGTTDRRRHGGESTDDDAAVWEFEERRLESLEPILWTARMEIGDQKVDADHRSIIALLNAIIHANQVGDRPRLGELLEQLGDQTAAHFENEERLMAGISHELFDEHRAEHQRLLDEYANQVDEFRKDKISAEFLCRFVYRWFVRHIEGLDATLKAA